MLRLVHLFACCFLISLLSSACSPVRPFAEPETSAESTHVLTKIATGGVFAPDSRGERVALARDGLLLVLVEQNRELHLAAETPLALAWSADGEQFAAAFQDGQRSRLVVYDVNGQELRSATVEGRATQLRWTPEGELLVLTIRLKVFSFGVNQRALLFHLDPQGDVTEQPLFDGTLKLKTVTDYGEDLYRFFRFDLAPLGDEIVYTRLSDPPVIRKSIKLIHQHLDVGVARQVYDLPLEAGGIFWSADNETLWLSNGSSGTFRYNLWLDRVEEERPLPGRHLAVSRSAEMQYVDGRLYRDGALITQLRDGRARFSADGRVLLIADGEQLYLYPLPVAESPQPIAADKLERLLQLRELRSKKLLSLEEYHQTKESLLR